MDNSSKITTMFLDIGGVLLTNGWDHRMRRRAAEKFGLDYDEFNDRHQMTFDTYERGLITLEEYLRRSVFHRKRDFTIEQFREFMFDQSAPLGDNIHAFEQIAVANDLTVAALNNEGRELNVFRIQKFALNDLCDFFISSCFVRFRKPDRDIFQLALDIAQVRPEHAVYIDDRQMFVEIAADVGIRGFLHEDMETTCKKLAEMGLRQS
ncbi:MAG: HAD family hydrolase [Solirubrobacterales bacterium]